MAIEAKMGMCIVVILLSAFGFLVYRKFDARQRDLLQANIEAAEQALPGSTGGDFVGEYSEFEKSNSFAASDLTDLGATELTTAADVALQDLDSAVSFGSSFALQDEPALDETTTNDSETLMADSGQDNPFFDSSYGAKPQADIVKPTLDQPNAGTELVSTETVDEFTNLAFATDSAATEPAGQMTSPLDVYLERRVVKEAAEQQISPVVEGADDSSFAAFGDPQQAAASTDTGTSFNGNVEAEFEATNVPLFSDSPQVVESAAPSFAGFPAGFEPEPEGFTNDAKVKETSAPADLWVKSETTGSSGQVESFPPESFDAVAEAALTVQPRTLVTASDDRSAHRFDGFDSFADDSQKTTVAAVKTDSEKVDWSSVSSLNQDSAAKTVESDSTQEPGFADFTPSDDSPFSGMDRPVKALPAVDRAAVNPPAVVATPPAFPSGFDQSFNPLAKPLDSVEALTEVSRPSLSAFTDSENDLNRAADVSSSRRPSIDPTTVIDPLNNVAKQEDFANANTTIQLAQTDFPRTQQPWDANGGILPMESNGTSLVSRANPTAKSSQQLTRPAPTRSSAVDPGLVNSFSGDAEFRKTQPQLNSETDRTLTVSENLRMPTPPYVQQAKTSIANTSKIQQVAGTRDPDGIYTVKPDDTYWTISKHAYGTARFFSSLALYNKNRIKDPRKLREGMKVVIPDPKVLVERYPELLQDYIPKKTLPSGYFLKPDGMPAYRIGARETLSEISQKHLGRASRWIQLYRMNQHVLKNPNRLKPGTVIDLPDDATNVHMVP